MMILWFTSQMLPWEIHLTLYRKRVPISINSQYSKFRTMTQQMQAIRLKPWLLARILIENWTSTYNNHRGKCLNEYRLSKPKSTKTCKGIRQILLKIWSRLWKIQRVQTKMKMKLILVWVVLQRKIDWIKKAEINRKILM